MAAHEPGWKNEKHRDQWHSTMEVYAYPIIAMRNRCIKLNRNTEKTPVTEADLSACVAQLQAPPAGK